MLTADPTAFPGCVVNALQPWLAAIDPDIRCQRRGLTTMDDVQAIGIRSVSLNPDESSKEMIGMSRPGYSLPTLLRYRFDIQGLVKHGDEQEGIQIHSSLAGRILTTLARSDGVRLALGELSHTELALTERATKWEVLQQRYNTRELDGMMMYLSVTEFQLETFTQ